jgi:MFS family permease
MIAAERSVGNRSHLALNAAWAAIQFQEGALLAIVVPALLLRLSPANHTAILAIVATIAAIFAALVPPIAGALSDRSRRRGGDRRVQTAVALGVDALAVLALAYATTPLLVGIALVIATIALTAAITIYQVLLPESVPRGEWGFSAGMRGVFTLVGTVAGIAVAGAYAPTVALVDTAIALVLGMITLVGIRRQAAGTVEHAVVHDRHDLIVTAFVRGWMVLGLTLLNTYILFFFADVLHVHDASLRTGLVAASALVGAIVSSVVAGLVSDRFDRRIVVALSGAPMTLAALGFAIAPDANLLFVYAGLFGLGFGGVFSVGWALALDTVPQLGDVARDLGAWATFSNLPAIVAPALGGFLIAHASVPRNGYRLVFLCSAVSFACGSLTVLRVRPRS